MIRKSLYFAEIPPFDGRQQQEPLGTANTNTTAAPTTPETATIAAVGWVLTQLNLIYLRFSMIRPYL